MGAERKASYIMPKNGLVPANMAVSASVITSGPSMDLFEKEEHGLTYTAFSRATRFSDVGIFDGFEASRFLIKIPMHKKMGLAEENRKSHGKRNETFVRTTIRILNVLLLIFIIVK